jgi:hypothetical protein
MDSLNLFDSNRFSIFVMIGVAIAAVIVIAVIVEGASSTLFPIEISLRMTDSLYPLGCSPQQMARFIFQKKKKFSKQSSKQP